MDYWGGGGGAKGMLAPPLKLLGGGPGRGLRLLEFATFNNLVLTNTLGPHKPSRRWTWHSPDGKHHNQIDYILVKKRFRSGVNIHRTRSFPGADIGSDHDLVMMTFQVRLKKTRKPNHGSQKMFSTSVMKGEI